MDWPDSRVGGRVQIKVYYEKKTFTKMQIGWQGLDQDGLARLQSGWIRVQYKKTITKMQSGWEGLDGLARLTSGWEGLNQSIL